MKPIARLLILSFLFATCQKNEEYSRPCIITKAGTDPATPINDPKITIIGKWATIRSQSDMTLLDPDYYEEYQPDSVFISYSNLPGGATFRGTYWLPVTDSLYYGRTYNSNDGKVMRSVRRYEVRFLDYNRFLLTGSDHGFSSEVYFYQRIECASK